MEVNYRITYWELMFQSIYLQLRQRSLQIAGVIVLGLMQYVVYDIVRRMDTSFAVRLVTNLVLMLAIVLGFSLLMIVLQALYTLTQLKCVNIDLKLTLTPEAVVQQSATFRTELYWKSVKRVELHPRHVFIFVSNKAAFIIPRRFFESNVVMEAYGREAERLHAAAKSA